MTRHRFNLFLLCPMIVGIVCVHARGQAAPSAPAPYALTIGKNGAIGVRLDDRDLFAITPPRVYRADLPKDAAVGMNGWNWITQTTQFAFDAERKTLDAAYRWGTLTYAYQEQAEGLTLAVTATNASAVTLRKLSLWLTGEADFPHYPYGTMWWMRGGEHQPAVAVTTWDTEAGRQRMMLAAIENSPDTAMIGYGHKQIVTLDIGQLAPGETATYTVHLRFWPVANRDGTLAESGHDLVQPVYDAFASRQPMRRTRWPDRRPISALHPSSAHLGAGTFGETTNPRGWKPAAGNKEVDITSEAGRERFKIDMLKWARDAAKVSADMDAQGVIVWSIEGQEFPHAVSYIGAPQKLALFAPEMDAIADEFMQIFTDAGLRVGLCIRPQRAIIRERPDHPATDNRWGDQIDIRDADGKDDKDAIIALLDEKISYAKERWNATIFYVDTNVSSDWKQDKETGEWKCTRWEILDYTIFERLADMHPDCLIIPEHAEFMYYAVSVPLKLPSEEVRRVWPTAFGVDYRFIQLGQHRRMNEPGVAQRWSDIVAAGNVLIFNGWYENAENDAIRRLYQAANANKGGGLPNR